MIQSCQLDYKIDLFNMLDVNKININTEPSEPSVSYLFEEIYLCMDPENEVPED